MNKNRFLLKFMATFWFLPAVYSLLAVILSCLIAYADVWLATIISNQIPDFFTLPKDTARSLYTSLVTAFLTMTAISFSNIMVILSTYSSQFSPRVLQDFIDSKVTQYTLGLFVFGFLVTLLNVWLLNIQGPEVFVSAIFTMVTAMVSLFAFVFFIHHSARWLQVNFLLNTLKTSSSSVINHFFKRDGQYGEHKEWDHADLVALKPEDATVISAEKAGYIQRVEVESLIEWAKKENLVLKAEFYLGDYVSAGMPLFQCWNMEGYKTDKKLENNLILISNERTNSQDIEFSLEKITEIALKGISPAMNDPHTSVNAIHRIGELMIELGHNDFPICYYTDKEDQLRLILIQKKFSDFLYKAFYQLRHYAKDDISVMYQILGVLYDIGFIFKGEYDEEVWEFVLYILEAIDVGNLSKLDYRHVKEMADKTAALYGKVSPMP